MIDYVVHVPIGGPAIEAAWVALGFGRASIVAVRDVTPIGRELPPDVAVRLAVPDELDVVDQLVDEEVMFHAATRCSSRTCAPRRETRCAPSSLSDWRVTVPDT